MAKRDQGEPTQPLSASQILAAAPPKPPTVSKHDASVWRGLVVGADDFAPQKAKRGVPRWAIFGAIGALAAGGVIIFVLRGGSAKDAAAPPPPVQSAVAPAAPAPADAMPTAAPSIASPGSAGARSTAAGSAESIASPGSAGARSTAAGSAESIAAAPAPDAAETVDAVTSVAPVPAKTRPALKKSKKSRRAH